MTTDIEKKFLYVHIHEKDRNFTRFFWLWINTSEPESKLVVYHFKTALFGAVSLFHIVCHTISPLTATQHSFVKMTSRQICMLTIFTSGRVTEADIVQYYHNARVNLSEAGCPTVRNFVLLLSRIRPLIQVLQLSSVPGI